VRLRDGEGLWFFERTPRARAATVGVLVALAAAVDVWALWRS